MSNLLPQENKKQVYKEYWVRVFSVWALLLALGAVSIAVLFLPTYILLSARIDTLATNEQKELASSTVTYKDVKTSLNEATTYVTQLDKELAQFDIALIIKELDKETTPAILITSVSLVAGEVEGEDGTRLSVRGVAQKRDDLAKYVERLKRNPYFSEAKVPVSDLAQAVDSEFTATIVVNTK